MDDRHLIQAYAAGDERAFEELVRRHLDWVYSVCKRRVRDESLTQDVTQAVFIALHRKAKKLQSHHSITGWLYQAAVYCSRDALKRQRTRQKHEQIAARQTPQVRTTMNANSNPVTLELIESALERLRSNDRQLVLLRFYEGKTHQEVAGVMNLTEAAARKRTERAIGKMRRWLTAHGVVLELATIESALLATRMHVPPELYSLVLTGAKQTAGITSAIAGGAMAAMTRTKVATIAIWLTASAGLVGAAGMGASWLDIFRTHAVVEKDARDIQPDAALSQLAKVYTLPAGQDLVQFKQPFPRQRDIYVAAQYPYAGGSRNVASLGFEWNNGVFTGSYMQYPAPSVRHLFDLVLRIPWYNFEHLERITWKPGQGDWVIRGGLSMDQKLSALAAFAGKEMGKSISFEKRVENRQCIVLKGPAKQGPNNGSNFHIVAVTLKPLSATELNDWVHNVRPRDSTHQFSVEPMAELLDAPFFADGEMGCSVSTLRMYGACSVARSLEVV